MGRKKDKKDDNQIPNNLFVHLWMLMPNDNRLFLFISQESYSKQNKYANMH